MINRHSLINGDIESTIDGEYVKYAEHSAVVDALRAELARVREADRLTSFGGLTQCPTCKVITDMDRHWCYPLPGGAFCMGFKDALAAGKGEGGEAMTADNYEDLVMTLRRRPELRSTPGKMDLDDAVIADSIEALVTERDQLRAALAAALKRAQDVIDAQNAIARAVAGDASEGNTRKILAAERRLCDALHALLPNAALAGKGEGEK